jgi:hypothetical protein
MISKTFRTFQEEEEGMEIGAEDDMIGGIFLSIMRHWLVEG